MRNSENSEDERCTENDLESPLLAGLKSGTRVKVDEEYWERMRQHIRDRAQLRQQQAD